MNTTKKGSFTIVLIAVLAALLLPAINAAREAGRRAQCISNQRQVALALLNFEQTRGAFASLNAPLKPDDFWNNCFSIHIWSFCVLHCFCLLFSFYQQFSLERCHCSICRFDYFISIYGFFTFSLIWCMGKCYFRIFHCPHHAQNRKRC